MSSMKCEPSESAIVPSAPWSWQDFQHLTRQHFPAALTTRLHLMPMALRLNVTIDEMRSALFESMQVR